MKSYIDVDLLTDLTNSQVSVVYDKELERPVWVNKVTQISPDIGEAKLDCEPYYESYGTKGDESKEAYTVHVDAYLNGNSERIKRVPAAELVKLTAYSFGSPSLLMVTRKRRAILKALDSLMADLESQTHRIITMSDAYNLAMFNIDVDNYSFKTTTELQRNTYYAEMMTVVKAGYNELWGFKWNKSLTGAKDTIKDVYTLFANDPNQAIILEPVKQVKYITIKYEAK